MRPLIVPVLAIMGQASQAGAARIEDDGGIVQEILVDTARPGTR
jgi:hypothetical protein